MRLQPAETIDPPTRAARLHALTERQSRRADSAKLRAVLDRALELPESLRLGFLLRVLNGQTKGNA